jgi:cytoskeletal protein RodZ
MKTKTIGEILREERARHRVSIEDVAKRTRIRLEYLQALEANKFHLLPAAPFVRGYIKSYAELFGFEYQPVLALLRRDYKESAKGTLVPLEFLKPVLKKRQVWTPVTIILMVALMMFGSLLAYVGAQWYSFTKPPALEILQPEEDARVSSQVVVQGKTIPEAVVLVNAQPVSLQPDGSFETEIFIPREGVASVTIEATDRRGKSNIEQRTVVVSF